MDAAKSETDGYRSPNGSDLHGGEGEFTLPRPEGQVRLSLTNESLAPFVGPFRERLIQSV